MLPTVGDRIKDSGISVATKSMSSDDFSRSPKGSHGSRAQDRFADRANSETDNPYRSDVQQARARISSDGWLATALAHPGPSRSFGLWVAIPAAIAFGISIYLAFTSLTSSNVAGCSGSMFDCESVLHSKWSRWFGIPVSLLATATYISLLTSLSLAQFGSKVQRNFMWMIVTACGLSAGAAAIWFTYLQFFVLDHLCQYCLAAHACGFVLAISILLKHPLGAPTSMRMGILAMAGLATIAVGQTLGTPPTTYTIEEYQTPNPTSTAGGLIEGNSASENSGSTEVTPSDNDSSSPAGDDSIFESPDIFEAPSFETSLKPIRHRLPDFRQSAMLLMAPRSLDGMVAWQETAQSNASEEVTDEQQTTDDNSTTKKSESSSESAGGKSAETESTQTQPAPVVRRLALISGGTIKLDVKQWPCVGNPDAQYVFVEMFDYACPHCRKTHATAIKGAQEKMAGQLAVLALPLPLNTNCNNAISQTGGLFGESCEIAKLAIAVWRVDPTKFTEFHNWMFIGEVAPTYAVAKLQAEKLVDPEKLAAELNSAVPAAYVGKHVQIYKMLGMGNVPKLMFPTTNIVGEFGSPDLLVELIRKQGPIVPVTVEAK